MTSKLSFDARYGAAWNELATRITLRQNALTIYVTLATGVVAILATGSTTGLKIEKDYFSLTIPALSIFLALLNFKHDKTIALLREYLRSLEDQDGDRVHGYNTNPEFRKWAEKYRNYHDYAAVVLIILFSLIGFFVASMTLATFEFTRWTPVIYLILTIISLGFVTDSSFNWFVKIEKRFGWRVTKEGSVKQKETTL